MAAPLKRKLITRMKILAQTFIVIYGAVRYSRKVLLPWSQPYSLVGNIPLASAQQEPMLKNFFCCKLFNFDA